MWTLAWSTVFLMQTVKYVFSTSTFLQLSHPFTYKYLGDRSSSEPSSAKNIAPQCNGVNRMHSLCTPLTTKANSSHTTFYDPSLQGRIMRPLRGSVMMASTLSWCIFARSEPACSTGVGKKVVPRLREFAPHAARGSQDEAGFTQPRGHSFALPVLYIHRRMPHRHRQPQSHLRKSASCG